jgi:ribosomal protein S14
MYYNFGDHTTDMNKEALYGLNEVMKVYVPIASYHINDASSKQILGKGIFRCRFCGKTRGLLRKQSACDTPFHRQQCFIHRYGV